MRVLLVSANREQINMPTMPLGLAQVAAATVAAGHETAVVDLMAAADPCRDLQVAVQETRPDIIGISVRNIDDQAVEDTAFLLDQAREVVNWCREITNAPIVVGGAGYSIFPQAALRYLGADMGIQGEGEVAFTALLECWQRRQPLAAVPGLYLPGGGMQAERHFVRNLDRLPLPDPSLLSTHGYESSELWIPVQTRRGCPLGCIYCSTGSIEGCRVRRRSAAVIVPWLQRWVEAGCRRFHFVDNTFNLPPSYALDLCRHIQAAGLDISWRAIVYPARINERLVAAMAAAGCREVALGFESGSPQVLRQMRKRFTPEEVRRASKLFAAHGISRMGFLLLGGPGETRETVQTSLEFADSLELELVKATVGIRIYPGTPLAAIAAGEGLISPADDLLQPRFYLRAELAAWLPETVAKWMETRPNWVS